MSRTDKSFFRIFSVYRNVQIVCLIMMSILVFLQVILRELFSIGIQWAYELSCFMQITLVWLGMPILLMKESNVQITVLYDKLPSALKRVIDILKYLIYVCCSAFLTIGYVLYVKNLGAVKSAVLRIPNVIFFIALIFGILMADAVLIFKFKQLIKIDRIELDKKLKEV